MFGIVVRTRLFWFGLLIIAIFSICFYLALARVTNASVKSQLLRRQGVLVKADAANIESFFEVFGESLSVVARLTTIDARDVETEQDMDAFVDQWEAKDFIGGLILTDSKGVVQYNSNIIDSDDVGANISDRDYFEWAINQPSEGEYFIGKPVLSKLGASKGQTIVPVASPVFDNEEFSGVLTAAVILNTLGESYLEYAEGIKGLNKYLLDEKGGVVCDCLSKSGPIPNAYDYFAKNSGETLDISRSGSFINEDYLVAYSPVALGSNKWFLVALLPVDEVSGFTEPIYVRQMAVILSLSLSIFLFAIIVFQERNVNHKTQEAQSDPKSQTIKS